MRPTMRTAMHAVLRAGRCGTRGQRCGGVSAGAAPEPSGAPHRALTGNGDAEWAEGMGRLPPSP
eukprot:gene5661-9515_t